MYPQGGHATALYMYIPSHHISYCYCCPQHHSTVSSVASPPLHSLPQCPSCCLPHSLHSPNSRTVVSESSGQSFQEVYLVKLSETPATATINFFVGVRWSTPPPCLHSGVRDPRGRSTCREGNRRTLKCTTVHTIVCYSTAYCWLSVEVCCVLSQRLHITSYTPTAFTAVQ